MIVTSSAPLTATDTSWTRSVMHPAFDQLPERDDHKCERGAGEREDGPGGRERRAARDPRPHSYRDLGDPEPVPAQKQQQLRFSVPGGMMSAEQPERARPKEPESGRRISNALARHGAQTCRQHGLADATCSSEPPPPEKSRPQRNIGATRHDRSEHAR